MTDPALAPEVMHRRHRVSGRHSRHSAELARLEEQGSAALTAVSFRELVGPLPADESSHAIYPYPARLVRHIPRFFLESDAISSGSVVIDPFCGSGTVLLEAKLSGRKAYGIDSNPIAVLIAEVKTTPLALGSRDVHRLAEACLAQAILTRRKFEPSVFVEKWYSPAAYSMLCRLASVIHHVSDGLDRAEANLLRLALARTALETSIRDPRIPVPVRHKDSPNVDATTSDVHHKFRRAISRLSIAVGRIPRNGPTVEVKLGDSRKAAFWPEPESPSVLITSPPYGAAQKYVRSTSLEAAWLGYTDVRGTRNLERNLIGREHLDRTERAQNLDLLDDEETREVVTAISVANAYRGDIYYNYFLDMQTSLGSGLTKSRPDAVILVCGTNHVAGHAIDTHRHLARMVARKGYRLRLSVRDEIRGRTLLTSRQRGAQPAIAEIVYLFDRADRLVPSQMGA